MPAPLPEKICCACGRPFQWRRRWARNWPAVRYCSAACRRDARQHQQRDAQLERAILKLLAQRQHGASICPGEVAREVGGDAWRELLEPVRRAARRLAVAGELQWTQRGRSVDPGRARGAVRFRRPGGSGT